MNNFLKVNKNFFAIIIGSIMIGGFVYFGLSVKKQVVIPAKAGIQIASLPSASRNDSTAAKTNSVSQNKKAEAGPPLNSCGASDNTIVTKVIDGDTVVVEGGYHVRLLGMDADENGYPCYTPAKIRLEELVLGKQVKLEKDKTDLDQYGRCLRYIFVGNTNIDVQLVQEGLAVVRFYNPDIKYKSEITEAEIYAQQNKLGCKWSGLQQTK